MRNTFGEELLDWMAVLDCKHTPVLCRMPAGFGEAVCARLTGQTMKFPWCGTDQTVVRAGLWDTDEWERLRDERMREQHLASLGHALGWCPCAAAAAEAAADRQRKEGGER